jgi:hypothetical protein
MPADFYLYYFAPLGGAPQYYTELFKLLSIKKLV